MEIEQTGSWGYGEGPLIIAGPCSAENEEQLMTIAQALKATGRVNIFRAGLWKPRSRPSSFGGEGFRALEWLRRVRGETGLPVAVEVASPLHAEACLKEGIDVIWLGARTVSNPFSVDEIVSVLVNATIPVLVKNPLSPDVELWIGAIERVYSAGIRKIAAVHRGFTPYEKNRYRNIPKWELAIELRSRIPSLPVICDPSHMSGKAALIPETAQKAIDMNMAGLMVEVHHDPPHALSDREQQLDPQGFMEMMEKLVFRSVTSGDTGFQNRLEELRNRIDSIDQQIIELVASRMRISKEMGEFKGLNDVTVFQLERWLEILHTRTENGISEGLDEEFIGRLMRIIHEESIRCQDTVMEQLRRSRRCPPEAGESKEE
ncbi:MAG: chorismate mutase [Bacteroidales bacterium]|jgi:chorismate mutase|nr:chorismate mutase [Bacteroidales bacterium]